MADQQQLIPEETFIAPLNKILDNVSPVSQQYPHDRTQSIKVSLDTLFPEQQHDEKQIKKAKEIIGPLVDMFTDAEIKNALTEIHFLTETWLDNFERNIFNGLTLQELLHEKGGK